MNSLNETTEFDSPTNADRKLNQINTNTPFTTGKYNSKSPKRSLLKKSKRRDCTPDSPQQSVSKLCQKYCKTGSEAEGFDNLMPVELFSEKNKCSTRKSFTLTLIEENIEEVQEKYYDYLGKQITPQSLYQSLFDKKEKEGNEEEKMSAKGIFTQIRSILSELNTFNFRLLENCQIVMITPDLQSLEASLEDFKDNFYRIDLDESQVLTLHSEENGLLFVKTIIHFKLDIKCSARVLFSKKNGETIEISVLELYS